MRTATKSRQPSPFAQNLTYDNGAGNISIQPGDRLPGPGSVTLQVFSPNPLTFTPASSDSATTGDPSIPAQARITNLSAAAASGAGTVIVAAYTANPTGVAFTAGSAAGAGAYFDVKVATGSAFGSVTVVRCGASATDKVYWFDGQAWQAVAPQSYTNGCITMNLDNTSSSPTIAQLTGTPFVLATPNGGSFGVPVTAATPELGSGELLATGLLPIGAVLLYRRRRRVTPRRQ